MTYRDYQITFYDYTNSLELSRTRAFRLDDLLDIMRGGRRFQ